MFQLTREQRDARLRWPARVAPPFIAAELGTDVDRVTALLADHVDRQLLEIGDLDFAYG